MFVNQHYPCSTSFTSSCIVLIYLEKQKSLMYAWLVGSAMARILPSDSFLEEVQLLKIYMFDSSSRGTIGFVIVYEFLKEKCFQGANFIIRYYFFCILQV